MIIQPKNPVILASASPRRYDLLTKIGLTFSVIPADIDESEETGSDPIILARNLALKKAEYVAGKNKSFIVIASDTVVALDEHILGKPEDDSDAVRMLSLLSCRTHSVITAYAVLCHSLSLSFVDHVSTEVSFNALSLETITEYVAGGSPRDKAGAYGIQDKEWDLVKKIEGSYENVMGFPVERFLAAWQQLFS